MEVVAAALETSLEVAAAALETSLEMVWMQPRLPTQYHRTKHYDDLAIEQLDLGWGRICYKKGMTLLCLLPLHLALLQGSHAHR